MIATIILVIAATTLVNGINPLKDDFKILPTNNKGHRLAGYYVNGNNKKKCDLVRPQIRTFGYCFIDTENQQKGIDTTKERGWVKEVVQQWEKCGNIKIVEEKTCRKGPDFISITVGDYHPVVFPEVDMDTCEIKGFKMYIGFNTFGANADLYKNQPESFTEKMRKASVQMYTLHEFGHFLGLDHEHNRNDRTGDCSTPVDEAMTGDNPYYGTFIITKQYDTESIMNYCTQWQHFKPWLSKLDKEGFKDKYGNGKINQAECDAVTKPWVWTAKELGGYAGEIDVINGKNNSGGGGGSKPTAAPAPPAGCADVASKADCDSRIDSCKDEGMKYWCPKTCKHCK